MAPLQFYNLSILCQILFIPFWLRINVSVIIDHYSTSSLVYEFTNCNGKIQSVIIFDRIYSICMRRVYFQRIARAKYITESASVININPDNNNSMQGYERIRVGSNLDVHDCNSLRLGAARACELAEVKRVKEKRCWIEMNKYKAL